jgi:hypothetical protein
MATIKSDKFVIIFDKFLFVKIGQITNLPMQFKVFCDGCPIQGPKI